MASESHRFFPPFHLDPVNAQLWRGEEKIYLRRKTFDVLLYLVDHPGQLVTKAVLDAVWAGVMVSDSMPAICVTELRSWATRRRSRASSRPYMAAATASSRR
jgi:DNA-binding winged helix-turn-helix (wHTH) protein